MKVLKYMSRGAISQATPNHAVPLFELLELEDITFGVFPRIGRTMTFAYGFGTENSVGDVIDMILQCLEVSYTWFEANALVNTPWRRLLPSCIAYAFPTECVSTYPGRVCFSQFVRMRFETTSSSSGSQNLSLLANSPSRDLVSS